MITWKIQLKAYFIDFLYYLRNETHFKVIAKKSNHSVFMKVKIQLNS